MSIFIANTGLAQIPTFSMSFDEFRTVLDDKIREDTLDKSHINDSTINKCKKVSDIYNCNFCDIGYQNSVKKFKDIGLTHGSFTQKLELTVSTYGGKVTRVALVSDRSDPMNLFQFEATVENILQIFDPDAVKGEGAHKKIADEIDSMRGDDAEDIGSVRSTIKPYAMIGCLSTKADVSTKVECQLVPRS